MVDRFSNTASLPSHYRPSYNCAAVNYQLCVLVCWFVQGMLTGKAALSLLQ